MKVNGKPISLYGAKLVDYTIGGTPVTQYSAEKTMYGITNKFSTKTANKTITVTLTFRPQWLPALHYRPTMRERLNKVTEQITQFDAEIISSKNVVLELPNGYRYICVPTTLGTASDDGSAVHDNTYTFTGVQVLPMLTVNQLNGFINCTSNVDTDCILKIAATDTVTSANVFGIKIDNLKANDIVVIDGIQKIVTCNGVNKFADVDLVAFPTLLPGRNRINVTPADKLEVTVSYYPTFI